MCATSLGQTEPKALLLSHKNERWDTIQVYTIKDIVFHNKIIHFNNQTGNGQSIDNNMLLVFQFPDKEYFIFQIQDIASNSETSYPTIIYTPYFANEFPIKTQNDEDTVFLSLFVNKWNNSNSTIKFFNKPTLVENDSFLILNNKVVNCYKDGEKNGKWIIYTINNPFSQSMYFLKGDVSVKCQQFFCKGKRCGEWICYRSDGSPLCIGVFKNNKLKKCYFYYSARKRVYRVYEKENEGIMLSHRKEKIYLSDENIRKLFFFSS